MLLGVVFGVFGFGFFFFCVFVLLYFIRSKVFFKRQFPGTSLTKLPLMEFSSRAIYTGPKKILY